MSFAKIRPRRGTMTEWNEFNPILMEGEWGVEYPDTGIGTGLCKFKFGNGLSKWSELPYAFIAENATAIDGGSVSTYNLIQVRRGTTEEWETADPIIEDGQIILDRTKMALKVGDGEHSFKALDYIGYSWEMEQEYDFGDENEGSIVPGPDDKDYDFGDLGGWGTDWSSDSTVDPLESGNGEQEDDDYYTYQPTEVDYSNVLTDPEDDENENDEPVDNTGDDNSSDDTDLTSNDDENGSSTEDTDQSTETPSDDLVDNTEDVNTPSENTEDNSEEQNDESDVDSEPAEDEESNVDNTESNEAEEVSNDESITEEETISDDPESEETQEESIDNPSDGETPVDDSDTSIDENNVDISADEENAEAEENTTESGDPVNEEPANDEDNENS